MILADAEAFAAALPRQGAIGGLDLGTVTIGVASVARSDATWLPASS